MNKIIKWNPEFAKNIWMELSLQRLIAMPAIIFIIVLLIFTNMHREDEAWQTLHYASLSGFVIVGLIWGIKTSADSIIDEYNDKTWDWQKMSIIGPWKLAFGKLFGSTIYNWYGALICWALFMYSSTYSPNPVNEYKTGILLIISMISLHGLMIVIALQMVRKNDGNKKMKSNRIFLVGFLFLGFFSRIFSLGLLFNQTFIKLSWYSLTSNTTDIAIITAVFYCAWIIAALYRSMRAELQFTDTPVWWLLFLVSNFIFHYGFFVSNPTFSTAVGLATCFTIVFLETLFMVYFLSLSESKDKVNFRILQNAIINKEYKHFFQNIPLWLTTLPITFLFGLLAVIFLAFSPLTQEKINFFMSLKINNALYAFLALIATMGFVLRDLGILLLLNFSARSKRADAAMIVYLLLLYILLPLLTSDLGIASIFYPSMNAGAFAMVIFPVLEAVVVYIFVIGRWKDMIEIPTNA